MKEIEGISISDGLKYCGSQKAFEKFLTSFYNFIDSKSAEIEDAYNRGDISFYTTKVHALKSSSRIIGAKELSSLAESLEKAGNSGDQALIDANTADLLTLYRSYKDKMSEYIGGSQAGSQSNASDKKPLPQDVLTEITNAMKELISFEDYDSVEMAIKDLKQYQLTDAQQETLDVIDMELKQLNWDKLGKLIKALAT